MHRKTSSTRVALFAMAAVFSTALSAADLNADDYTAIQQLYARYNTAIDHGDGEGWAGTFTADGVFANNFKGHDALVGFVNTWRTNPAMNGAMRRHFSADLVITPSAEGATATVSTLLVDLSTKPVSIANFVTYSDVLVKTTGRLAVQDARGEGRGPAARSGGAACREIAQWRRQPAAGLSEPQRPAHDVVDLVLVDRCRGPVRRPARAHTVPRPLRRASLPRARPATAGKSPAIGRIDVAQVLSPARTNHRLGRRSVAGSRNAKPGSIGIRQCRVGHAGCSPVPAHSRLAPLPIPGWDCRARCSRPSSMPWLWSAVTRISVSRASVSVAAILTASEKAIASVSAR